MSAVVLLSLLVSAQGDTVNDRLGDLSWVIAFGSKPASVSADARIAVHLEFVERLLRSRDVLHLRSDVRARRAAALDALAVYRKRGLFPRRTNDGYRGMRPRFIDDRGVHCAVGELIKQSGAPALAAAIDRDFEYAYVPDILSPALAAWAVRHGFTTDELAMIQPGYSPVPTAETTKAVLHASVDGLTLRCGRKHRVPKSIPFSVRGTKSGAITVTTRNRDPFSMCAVKLVHRIERGGGAYDAPIRTYRFETRVKLRPPQAILEERVKIQQLHPQSTRCTPRPGPLVEKVWFSIEVGADGPTVDVKTQPNNPEVTMCMTQYLERSMRDFLPGTWRLKASAERDIQPQLSSEWLGNLLNSYAPNRATDCSEPAGPKRAKVTARAVVDAPAFDVRVDGGSKAFRKCVAEKVAGDLRSSVTLPRQLVDGTYERYFRIDADAFATVDIAVESKAAREKRNEEERKRFEEDQYRLN